MGEQAGFSGKGLAHRSQGSAQGTREKCWSLYRGCVMWQ